MGTDAYNEPVDHIFELPKMSQVSNFNSNMKFSWIFFTTKTHYNRALTLLTFDLSACIML